MKRVYLLLIFLIQLVGYSQSIKVNKTAYTTEQLINDVLINTPCVLGKNFNSKSGNLFGSTNGIGYFENTNPNFPFKRGVILTTGDVNKAEGPNGSILSDGNAAWSGDSDLENILLSQSGITMKSINASFIEFEFTPKSPNFDFSFLFASEEYGTAQCNYSDAFAFLLQDITSGSTPKNLALIPNTNFPVSVETIRDGANNAGCPSANLPYFGSFNGDGFGPAINFNGQTVRMIASATGLDINHTYKIKLVIADGGDNTEYDSAIFIEADSFNIGQNVLGLDYTAENNRALCFGDALPILTTSGVKPGTTFVWQKNGQPFSPQQTETELNLNVVDANLSSGIHEYSVIYSEPSCAGITDSILVEIYPRVNVMENVINMFSCDTSNGITTFDLNKKSNEIRTATNLDTATAISYHLTKSDAELNINPLPNQYSIPNTTLVGETIFMRVKGATNTCFEIRSFKLITNELKFDIIPAPETLCARSFEESPINAFFNLNDQKKLLLGNLDPGLFKITFYNSQSDANSDIKAIPIPNSGSVLSTTQTIWARLENILNTDCFITTSFELIVKPIPNVDKLENVFVCDSFVLPKLEVAGAQYWTNANGQGTQLFEGHVVTETSILFTYNFSNGCYNQHSFRVTIIKTDEMVPPSASYCSEYTLPTLPYGRYFTLSGGIYTPGNVELFPGNIISTIGKNTIYVWYEDKTVTPICLKENSFDITIISWDQLPKYEDQFDCSSFTLPVDPNGGVYYSGPKKKLPIIPAGTVITSTTTIYVYKESTLAVLKCASEESFKVQIGIKSLANIVDVEVCSSYVLPRFTVGEFRTASDGGGSVIAPGTVFTENVQIWYYIKGQSCTDKTNFTVTISKDPVPTIQNIAVCNIYNLPQIAFSGDYFSGPSGSGTLYPVGTPIIKSQKVYFFDKSSNNACNAKRNFEVKITPSAKLDAKPVEVLSCGKSYILDDLKKGEYYEFSGGPSATNPPLRPGFEIKSSKTIYAYAPGIPNVSCTSEYSISVIITTVNPIPDQFACSSFNLPNIIGQGDYYTAPNGPNGTGKKLTFPYEPITSTTRIYIYAQNDNRVSCFDEKSFLVTIYNIAVAPIAPIKACESYSLPNLIAPATRYFIKAGGPSASNTELFPNSSITTTTTIYAYGEIGTKETALCFDEKPFEITIVQKQIPQLKIPTICVDLDTNIVTNAYINSNYDPSQYSFEWKKEDGTLVSTQPDFSTNTIGNYTFQINDLGVSTGCLSEKSNFSLMYSSGPKEVTYTTSDWFADTHSVTVNAIPFPGYSTNFTYALNGGTPQTSNFFTGLEIGTHEIVVTDANLCGNSNTFSFEIKFPFYPKFFTPNGDGFNDNWKLTQFDELSKYNINIYDRYGKLIKQISSDNDNWDGNYMGSPLPSDDYWFTISYTQNETPKIFKAHFSLVR